jgi:hypothetical protein
MISKTKKIRGVFILFLIYLLITHLNRPNDFSLNYYIHNILFWIGNVIILIINYYIISNKFTFKFNGKYLTLRVVFSLIVTTSLFLILIYFLSFDYLTILSKEILIILHLLSVIYFIIETSKRRK